MFKISFLIESISSIIESENLIESILDFILFRSWVLIFLLALFTTISIMVVNQLGNQMKSITNRHDDIQIKYTAEAGIERTIREVCDEISNKLSDESSSTKNIQENNIQKAYLNKENYAYKSSSISNIQNELSSIKDNLNPINQIQWWTLNLLN